MADVDRGQVTASAAEVYDSFFVPALFAQWSEVVLDAAGVQTGDHVVDVGCGTGVLAAAAHGRVGPSGRVAAVDPNDGMLAVARRNGRAIEWRPGVAEDLPFPDDTFDRVVSQFALMFFSDPRTAFGEIARVTRADGRIAVAVWGSLDDNVGYSRLTDLVERLFGARSAQAIRAPFQMGHAEMLVDLASSGITDPDVSSHRGTARFESLHAWLHTEIRGWTLADEIDDDGFDRLLGAAGDELGDLANGDGVAFPVSALVVSGTPRWL